MLRSGFILGVSAPAVLLTVLVHPIVRDTADRMSSPSIGQAFATTAPVVLSLPGTRPASIALSPTRVAGVPRLETRPGPMATQSPEPELRPALKPRRSVREGCETALSSLVGPEARRMTPGRCIS